jgi:hypothetical protein
VFTLNESKKEENIYNMGIISSKFAIDWEYRKMPMLLSLSGVACSYQFKIFDLFKTNSILWNAEIINLFFSPRDEYLDPAMLFHHILTGFGIYIHHFITPNHPKVLNLTTQCLLYV